ncbi:MAG TPA: metallophosphoesterase [Capsulimonadaceae bacterium]|jgi:protein phosphatase
MITGYDIIGDVHGHLPQLRALCKMLGYDTPLTPPAHRRLVFVGDFADRGPANLASILAVRDAVLDGRALAVLGNHDDALLKWLKGGEIPRKGGIEVTMAEIENAPNSAELRRDLIRFFVMLPLVLHLDEGRLIVAHAGIEQPMLERALSLDDRKFILNGEKIGKRADGKTLRRDWALTYTGDAFIAYGHTPQDEIELRPNSANIDSGVYITGTLTALRWPERELVAVTGRAGE